MERLELVLHPSGLEQQPSSSQYPASLFAATELSLAPGESLALLGASGSGKSTLLRLMAGLYPQAAWWQMSPLPHTIRLSLMSQNDGLLPWFSVVDNISLGARLRGEAVDQSRCSNLLKAVGLQGYGTAKPAQLSGGMRQRVALARALYEQADLLLLDEPFGALDALTRRQMQDLTQAHTQKTSLIFVTHDPNEAWRIADRIVLLEGTPVMLQEFDRTQGRDALWERVLQKEDS